MSDIRRIIREELEDRQRKSAQDAVQLLSSKGKSATKEDVQKAYDTLKQGGWTDDQLPDVRKALAVWDSDRKSAMGYLFSGSKQGNPIEKKITGGGGGGVVNDLSKLMGEGARKPKALRELDKNIREFEDILDRLTRLRTAQRRGSAGKTDMTRAMGRVRNELSKARRKRERLLEID